MQKTVEIAQFLLFAVDEFDTKLYNTSMSMLNFTQFLTEAQKTYKFTIRVAGEVPEGFEDRMETHLGRFDLVNVSAGKRTPISEKPLDFPQLSNCEVTHYEAELKYPTT